jgi:hypothetical protein
MRPQLAGRRALVSTPAQFSTRIRRTRCEQEPSTVPTGTGRRRAAGAARSGWPARGIHRRLRRISSPGAPDCYDWLRGAEWGPPAVCVRRPRHRSRRATTARIRARARLCEQLVTCLDKFARLVESSPPTPIYAGTDDEESHHRRGIERAILLHQHNDVLDLVTQLPGAELLAGGDRLGERTAREQRRAASRSSADLPSTRKPLLDIGAHVQPSGARLTRDLSTTGGREREPGSRGGASV